MTAQFENKKYQEKLLEAVNIYRRNSDDHSMDIYRCFRDISTGECHVQQKDFLNRKNLSTHEDPELIFRYYLHDFFMDLPDENEPRRKYATFVEAIYAFDLSFKGK